MKLGERLASAVFQASSLPSLLQAVQAFYQGTEHVAAEVQTTLPQQPACGAGCFYCCHIPVGATAPEVFAVAAHVGTHFTPGEQQALLARLQQHVQLTASVPATEQATIHTRCPLLVEGRCSIHPARPLACRRFHSLDVSPCVSFYEQPSLPWPPPPQSPELLSAWQRIIRLSDRAFATSGYDTAGYELGSALLETLSDAEVPVRYLAKQRTFLRAKAFWPSRT